jgi:hypothetical protein
MIDVFGTRRFLSASIVRRPEADVHLSSQHQEQNSPEHSVSLRLAAFITVFTFGHNTPMNNPMQTLRPALRIRHHREP